MTYTPPGIQTRVIIDNTIVSLPGGTRVLSLLGNADRTKSVSGEAQDQPINRTVTVDNSGLSAISRIYDYSGPGNSLYTYTTSGAGTFGSGYYNSGDNILWTPAANPYPSSTTPQIGATYYATYGYSGTSLSGTIILKSQVSAVPDTFSGAVFSPAVLIDTVLNPGGVVQIYDGADISSANPYSGLTTDPSGAGWTQTGTSIVWNNGTYADFAAANSDGAKVPASGQTYYIHYEYSGSTTATFTGNAAYNNEILVSALGSGMTTVTTIASTAVSGTNVVYPYSGTATGPDANGYGQDGSGWVLSGTTAPQAITWSAVDPAYYGYPAATVVPISGVFYIDYSYNKTSTDYQPKNFADYRNVVNEYGNEASWNLITSGVNAGTYELFKINPLTLGSKIAFENNASLLILVQNSGTGNTSGDYLQTVAKLEAKTVDLIVPLTVGSGIASIPMSVSEKAAALNYVKLHCETMSNEINKKERVSLGSLGPAEIGDNSTANTYIYTAGTALDSKRISLIAPGTATLQLQDPAGTFHDVDVDGCFLAVAVASISASTLNDVATPLTNKELNSFTAISAVTAGHSDVDYLETEKNNMAAAGVMIIDNEGPRIFVRHQLTTDQSNVVNGEFSVVTLIDYVAQAVRFSCNQYIGKKLKPATTIPAVKGSILATLQALAQNDIISSIGGITVTINTADPTELLVEAAYVPIFPLNRIKVTFTIKTLA